MLRTAIVTTCALLLLALTGAAVVVWSGVYPVGATRQHFQPVYTLLETTLLQSVRLRARDITAPPLDDQRLVQRGASCFRDKCVECHGAPGVAQGDIGKGMQPLPGPLVDAQQRWKPRELYWITKNGIRMSGMPAWEFRLPDQDLWALVAFMQRLPTLSPQDYAQATQAQAGARAAGAGDCGLSAADKNAAPRRPADIERGRVALYQYACSACHTIPGVTGSSPQVGPPLAGIASRTLIAGKLANTRQNMVIWIRWPRTIDPLTAMPDLEVSADHAQDIAAYLETLR